MITVFSSTISRLGWQWQDRPMTKWSFSSEGGTLWKISNSTSRATRSVSIKNLSASNSALREHSASRWLLKSHGLCRQNCACRHSAGFFQQTGAHSSERHKGLIAILGIKNYTQIHTFSLLRQITGSLYRAAVLAPAQTAEPLYKELRNSRIMALRGVQTAGGRGERPLAPTRPGAAERLIFQRNTRLQP